MTIFTVGHSTRPLGEFIALLKGHGIQRLMDVRTVPRSRHNPQFNRDTLSAALSGEGIEYEHIPDLGGLRTQQANSINTGWHNPSFRAYADYMQTQAFSDAIEHVIESAQTVRIALMCAEAVPWRCHRSLIADALLIRDIVVEEIVTAKKSGPHRLTPFARVEGARITYPPGASHAVPLF